jgi:hypothetical protein
MKQDIAPALGLPVELIKDGISSGSFDNSMLTCFGVIDEKNVDQLFCPSSRFNFSNTASSSMDSLVKGYPLRFRDLSSVAVSETMSTTDTLQYLFLVWLPMLFDTTLFIVDFATVVFLVPGSLGDHIYPNLSEEYSIPYGHQRYIVVVALGMLLLISFLLDFVVRGLIGSNDEFIAPVVLDQYASRFASMISVRKWKFIKRVVADMTPKQRYLVWVLKASSGWKRFILCKIPLSVALCFTLYNGIFRAYRPIDVTLQNTAITYGATRLIMYTLQLVQNLVAGCFFLAWKLKDQPKVDLHSSLTSVIYTIALAMKQSAIVDNTSVELKTLDDMVDLRLESASE